MLVTQVYPLHACAAWKDVCKMTSASHALPSQPRWLVARELLCSQGFPVFESLCQVACGKQGVPLCSFNVDRERLGLSPRKWVPMAGQAGNSMNVNMIGASMVQQLAFTVRVDCLL